MRTCTRCVVGFCLCLLWASEAYADRALLASIELIEGRVELVIGTYDDGKATKDQVWQYLKRLEFLGSSGNLSNGSFRLVPDKDNPLQATLTGKIRVTIQYGGEAEVTQLRLVRKHKDGSGWRIHPEDVDAMAKKRR